MMQQDEVWKKLVTLSQVYEKKFGDNPMGWIVESGHSQVAALKHMQEAIDKNDISLLETEEGSPL